MDDITSQLKYGINLNFTSGLLCDHLCMWYENFRTKLKPLISHSNSYTQDICLGIFEENMFIK